MKTETLIKDVDITDLGPSIFVMSLDSKIQGSDFGTWVNLSECVDGAELKAKIEDIVKSSPHFSGDLEAYYIEEFANFKDLDISKYSDFDDLVLIAKAIEEHGEYAALMLKYNHTTPDMVVSDCDEILPSLPWSNNLSQTEDFLQQAEDVYSGKLIDFIDENYYGYYRDDEEFGREQVSSYSIEIPSHMVHFFDYADYGREEIDNGEYIEIDEYGSYAFHLFRID